MKHLYMSVPHDIMHNSQKVEASQMFINCLRGGWVGFRYETNIVEGISFIKQRRF